jgi:hypothetical protein
MRENTFMAGADDSHAERVSLLKILMKLAYEIIVQR